jgi:hypothetical protein
MGSSQDPAGLFTHGYRQDRNLTNKISPFAYWNTFLRKKPRKGSLEKILLKSITSLEKNRPIIVGRFDGLEGPGRRNFFDTACPSAV